MAQNLVKKRFSIASDSVKQAAAILAAADQLVQNAGILTQAGGNFEDSDFDGSAIPAPTQAPATSLIYLNAFQMNVFLQQVTPALTTFLDSHLNGDAGQPTYRDYFRTIVSGAV